MSRTRTRTTLGVVATIALTLAGLTLQASAVSAVPLTSQAWTTAGTYDWVVPAGVTSVTIEARGAEGASAPPAVGGTGGAVTGTLPVTPGEALRVRVGGAGILGGAGGFNGGGAATASCVGLQGGSGGGGSDVRRGGDALTDRVIVAGGGGGAAGADISPGGGGVGGGSAPAPGGNGLAGMTGGAAGTAVAGGAGGFGFDAGAGGSLGTGGDAGTDGCTSAGAGGGGYYGGGGGGQDAPAFGAGGGGGSAYVDPAATGVSMQDGAEAGDGSVTISWTQPPAPPATDPPKAEPPAAAAECPSPVPAVRVFPTRFSVLVSKFLIDNCGSTARGLIAGGMPIVVVDPPAGSACPPWVPVRVRPDRPSVLIAAFLLEKCAYTLHGQRNGGIPTIYVVPSGWPPGTRVTSS